MYVLTLSLLSKLLGLAVRDVDRRPEYYRKYIERQEKLQKGHLKFTGLMFIIVSPLLFLVVMGRAETIGELILGTIPGLAFFLFGLGCYIASKKVKRTSREREMLEYLDQLSKKKEEESQGSE